MSSPSTVARDRVVPDRTALVGGLVVAAGGVTLLAVAVGTAAETVGAWWPTSGIAAVALLLAPRRRVPVTAVALLVVLLAAGLLGGRTPVVAAGLAVVDVVEALVVCALVRRSVGPHLTHVRQLGPLLVALGGAAILGGLGVATVLLSVGEPFGATSTVAGLAHAAALLVLVPPALLDWHAPWPPARGIAVLALGTGGVLALAFSEPADGLTGLTLLVLPLPLVVVAAVRFDTRAVSLLLVWLATLLSAAVVTSPNAFGDGGDGAETTTQVAQVYLVTLVLLVLPMLMAVRERDEVARRTRESERVFRRAFVQSGLPVLLGRWDGRVVRISSASDACAGLLGRAPDALVGTDLNDVVDVPALLAELGSSPLREFAGWSGPLDVLGATHLQVEGYVSLLDVDGDRGLLSLHLVDLTDRLRLEQRLRHELVRSQAVMDTASSLIVITDLDGRVVTANPETTRLTGWTEADLVGRPLWETIVAPRDRQAVQDALGHELPIPRSGDLHLLTRSGAERTIVYSHTGRTGADDAPMLVFSGTDVSEARRSAEMVDHLLRSVTSLAFVATDLDGTVTLFSAGAERLLGVSADQVRGQAFGRLLAEVPAGGSPATDPAGPGSRPGVPLDRLVGAAGVESAPRTRDWLALPPGRSPVQVSMTCNPVRSSAGVLGGYLFVARDVTDTRRNQEIMVSALRREREVVTRLQDLDRAKDDFISTVSHELRTPMSSIIGSAELLEDGMAGDLRPDQAELVDVISRNGARLLGLADDLLTLATFDRGAEAASTAGAAGAAGGTRLDLRRVVDESLGVVRPRQGDARLQWQVDLPGSPVPVVGEESHLERAVTNLLTNAVKFTPDGGTVSVAVRPDPRRGTATVTVSDTGRGIPESDLAHVFDRFYRSADAQRHAVQGTGLGLSIVKQIVERHEGRVAVDSRHGEGTSVSITIPLARTPDDGRGGPTPATSPPAV